MIGFKFGGPIEPDLFYDREKEIGFLLNKLLEIKRGIRHSYALVGPRRMGKSSIIRLLEGRLVEKDIIPIIIDCEGREIAKQAELTLELFLNLWGNSVLDAYFEHARAAEKITIRLKKSIIGTKDSIVLALSEVLGRVRALEIKTISDYLNFRIEFEKATERRKPSSEELMQLFEDTMNLSERIGEEEGEYFIIMLDEFQNVGKFKLPFPFIPAFRRHLQQQKRTTYLLTGSNIGMMENILLGGPFGGHIPIEWVNSFDFDVACSFLRERFAGLSRVIEEDAIREIAKLTNGHPAYLNWFGEQCCKEIGEGERIPIELVWDLGEKIFERDGLMHVFEEYIRKVSPKKGKIFQTFVEMIGHDLTSPSEISKHVVRSTPTEIITYLKRLEQRGFIRRIEEGRYVVVDEMLRNYVKKKIHST
ncbi:MAG: ATP-binding protein [Euryarchaeota archaeon]|nr:ATP-binding protein [Euryarchaeota archaeon]